MASNIDTSRPTAANALTADIAGNFATATTEITALQSAAGALGPAAATGMAGTTGVIGPTGTVGVAGPTGPTGSVGLQGPTGDPAPGDGGGGGGGGSVLVSDTMPTGTQPDGTLWVDYNAPQLWVYIAAHGAFYWF